MRKKDYWQRQVHFCHKSPQNVLAVEFGLKRNVTKRDTKRKY